MLTQSTHIIIRCEWCEKDELYRNYHDLEWGKPIYDDKKLYEFLLLESFQAGLSWYAILSKRENFRKAFDDFDYKKIATYSAEKTTELLQNVGIIRNRLKIEAAVNNAKQFIKIQNEFESFSNYVWHFVENTPILNNFKSIHEIPAKTEISDRLSKDLKKRGFKFVGSTIIYSFMQAVGMTNDHITGCHFI